MAAQQNNAHYINNINETIYIGPRIVHNMFQSHLDFEQFHGLCVQQNVMRFLNQNIAMTNFEYIKQLYVRYLCFTGQTDMLLMSLNNIYNNMHLHGILFDDQNNENNFHHFINRVDVPGFENQTLMDTAIMYYNNTNIICVLHNMGGVSHINYRNVINHIHRTEWFNPFNNIINIPHAPQFNGQYLMEHNIIQNNLHGNINNVIARRHISHFENIIHALYAIMNNEDQMNEDVDDMLHIIHNFENPHDIMLE